MLALTVLALAVPAACGGGDLAPPESVDPSDDGLLADASVEVVGEPADSAGAGGGPSAVAAPEESPARSVFPVIDSDGPIARWTVEIVERVAHDPDAFTQGLEVADGTMYESTGLRGRSSLRSVDAATGEVTALVELADEHFGEGLTVVGDQIIQLTWQSGTAIVYDRATLTPTAEHRYDGEGWGLCLLDDVLVMSDGSDRLSRRDPATFELLGTVTLAAPGYDGRLDYLNELECVEGLVIANVWQTDRLLVVAPLTGRVVAVIDARPLMNDLLETFDRADINVLNGVAVADEGTLWMTGKLWPRLYRVRIAEAR